MKVSTLIEMLEQHLEMFGDDKVNVLKSSTGEIINDISAGEEEDEDGNIMEGFFIYIE